MATNQKQISQGQNTDLATTKSKPLFLSVLSTSDPLAIKNHLSHYKDRGMVSFRKVLEIPLAERIPELAAHPQIRFDILTALTASLKSAFSNINLRVGMNEEQIVELADMIIDQSHEDNLGLEDVLLFLNDLLTGKAGKIYDRLDIPTFFELFETYRQKRHDEMKSLRDDLDAQYRSLPVNDRFVHDSVQSEREISREAMKAYLRTLPPDQE